MNNPPPPSPRQYDLDDPALLDNMVLTDSIKHPETGVVLVTRKSLLTEKILKQLAVRGITSVQAEPQAGELLSETAEDVKHLFSLVEEIISVKGQTIHSAAITFQEKRQVKELRDMVAQRMRQAFHLFNERAADAMIELNQHHPDTAHHSVITGFIVMGVAKRLGWGEEQTLQAVIAAMQHDIGKIKVRLDTLDWPGRLDKKKWGEIQLHTLFGGRLLYEGTLDLPVMVALAHHEWYSTVPGKGYGGFSIFRRYLKKGMEIDIPAYLEQASDADLQAMQLCALADMVSALEEIRSYKGALPPFKVLVIMNSDARLGHFNPQHYRIWHTSYLQKHPTLLAKGFRAALPREKEAKLFEPGPPHKLTRPTPVLTYQEMERLNILPRLRSRGLDLDRVRRRGGLSLERLRQVEGEDGTLGRLLTPGYLQEHHVEPMKRVLPRERQSILLEAFVRHLSFNDLKTLDLLYALKQKRFDLNLVQEKDGIRIERMEKRGIPIRQSKLEKFGIDPLRPVQVKLPAFEDRLTLDDLKTLGYGPERLEEMGLLAYVNKRQNGAAIIQLKQRGLTITNQDLARARIDPERKIFYDIIVVQPLDRFRGAFAIVREGDDLAAIEEGMKTHSLDPIQKYLHTVVGVVEMDFSDLLEVPNELDTLTIGDHWRAQEPSG